MYKRLAAIGALALVAASFGTPVASAQGGGDYGTFTLTVNKVAYTNQFKTALTVTGTYNCAPNFEPTGSNLNVNVSEIQGKGTIVTGGSGMGSLQCDGLDHGWVISDVFASSGGGPGGGTPATWKNGRATVNVNGGAGVDCQPGQECVGIGANIDRVIQIR